MQINQIFNIVFRTLHAAMQLGGKACKGAELAGGSRVEKLAGGNMMLIMQLGQLH